MTAQPVYELELPPLRTIGLERMEAITAVEATGPSTGWPKREMGYCVTRLDDVTAVLRDKRFHSALSMLPQLAGWPEREDSGHRQLDPLHGG